MSEKSKLLPPKSPKLRDFERKAGRNSSNFGGLKGQEQHIRYFSDILRKLLENDVLSNLPVQLETIFAAMQEPDAIFAALMPALCETLHCDRCFLYLRKPETNQGRVTHCYRTNPKWADLTDADWIDEGDIASIDPLMEIAFRTDEAIYVDDVETASPDVINLAYEQEFFKHRALIHLPIYQDGKLYAIVEPCVFDQPRQWTDSDRAIVADIQTRLAPLVVSYLELGGHERTDPASTTYPD